MKFIPFVIVQFTSLYLEAAFGLLFLSSSFYLPTYALLVFDILPTAPEIMALVSCWLSWLSNLRQFHSSSWVIYLTLPHWCNVRMFQVPMDFLLLKWYCNECHHIVVLKTTSRQTKGLNLGLKMGSLTEMKIAMKALQDHHSTQTATMVCPDQTTWQWYRVQQLEDTQSFPMCSSEEAKQSMEHLVQEWSLFKELSFTVFISHC